MKKRNLFIEESLIPFSGEVLELIDEDSENGKFEQTDIIFAVEEPVGGVTIKYYSEQEIKKVHEAGKELGDVFANMSQQKIYGFSYA